MEEPYWTNENCTKSNLVYCLSLVLVFGSVFYSLLGIEPKPSRNRIELELPRIDFVRIILLF